MRLFSVDLRMPARPWTGRNRKSYPVLGGLILAMFAVGLLVGCASLKKPPQQAYVYDIAGPCRVMGFVDSFTVDEGGHYYATFRGSGPAVFSAPGQFKRCMEEQQRLHPFQEWLQRNPPPSARVAENSRQDLVAVPPAATAVGVNEPGAEARGDLLSTEVAELIKQDRFAEAIPKAQEALRIREQALGSRPVDVARSLNNLAFLLQTTGDYRAAGPLY
jgi:Tetratricopeptide repeat